MTSTASHSLGDLQTLVDETRARILHQLEIFPYLSKSMLHMAIGTSTPNTLWAPILEDLVQKGYISTSTFACKTPSDRHQTYTVYFLAKYDYTYGPYAPDATLVAATQA